MQKTFVAWFLILCIQSTLCARPSLSLSLDRRTSDLCTASSPTQGQWTRLTAEAGWRQSRSQEDFEKLSGYAYYDHYPFLCYKEEAVSHAGCDSSHSIMQQCIFEDRYENKSSQGMCYILSNNHRDSWIEQETHLHGRGNQSPARCTISELEV